MRYITANKYCQETGFPRSQMDRLLHSYLAEEFSYRSGSGKTSPFYILTDVFEKKMIRGDFREILEG